MAEKNATEPKASAPKVLNAGTSEERDAKTGERTELAKLRSALEAFGGKAEAGWDRVRLEAEIKKAQTPGEGVA